MEFLSKKAYIKVTARGIREFGMLRCDVNRMLIIHGKTICFSNINIELNLPNNLLRMIELAEELSKRHDIFLHVGFYILNGVIYFGKRTFYLNFGCDEYKSYNWSLKMDEKLESLVLNKRGRKNNYLFVRKEVRLCV